MSFKKSINNFRHTTNNQILKIKLAHTLMYGLFYGSFLFDRFFYILKNIFIHTSVNQKFSESKRIHCNLLFISNRHTTDIRRSEPFYAKKASRTNYIKSTIYSPIFKGAPCIWAILNFIQNQQSFIRDKTGSMFDSSNRKNHLVYIKIAVKSFMNGSICS